jgi:formiminoglutamate deiminase
MPERDVTIGVTDGRIASVVSGRPARASAVRLKGLTLPGIANVHSHAFHRVLRARAQRGTGSFWTWREQMYEVASALDPDLYAALARAVFAEMVGAGYTCVGEFHYVHHDRDGVPYADPNALSEAVVVAAADAGIRLTLLDTCYLCGGIGRDVEGVQRRFSDGTAVDWAERVEGLARFESPTLRVGAAIHSVRAVPPGAMETVRDVAASDGCPLHAHVSEQPAENAACLEAFGITPVALLAEHGCLDPRFTAVHATHLAPADVGLLGQSASTVCLCPTTERDLADGIGPAAALAGAGVALTIGSDSHAVIDPFEETRAIELHERLGSGERGHFDPMTLLRAATENGYRSLGWDGGGRLHVGAVADFVTVRMDSVRTAGGDPALALDGAVYSANATDVSNVVVAGRTLVRDGRHQSLDVERELEGALRAVWAVLAK